MRGAERHNILKSSGTLTNFPNHLCIAKIAGGRITRAAERDRANMPFLARQRFGAHHGRVGIEA
jgi:hypothetical protein